MATHGFFPNPMVVLQKMPWLCFVLPTSVSLSKYIPEDMGRFHFFHLFMRQQESYPLVI